MIKKLAFGAGAAGCIAAASGVVIVALAYALFAWMREYLTPAGAAAVVAGAFALLLVIGALVFALKGNLIRPKPEPTLVEKAADFAREKPIIAVVGALAASFIAIRNPALVATLVAGMMAPKTGNKR